MKLWSFFLIAALMTGSAFAAKHKLEKVNAETPDGKILAQIMSENDPAKKLALSEQFAQEQQKSDAYGYVLFQMQKLYMEANQYDKVIDMGHKLLALDPDDLDAAYAALKAAEAKKDPDALMKWSDTTSAIAKRAIATPKKAGDDDDEYKQSIEHAKDVDTYSEYALYSMAIQSSDVPKVMAMIEKLLTRNPQTQYAPAMLERYTVVARSANAMDKAVALGEAEAAKNQYNEDLLLAMSDYFMTRKQNDKTLTYSAKLVEVMNAKPKPEGVADAAWDRKKKMLTGLGYWMQGMTEAGEKKYGAADKSLKAALPFVQDDQQILSYTLFNIGLANYQMAKASKNKAQIAEAVKFTEAAAAKPGPMQGQAAKNVKAMKAEFGVK